MNHFKQPAKIQSSEPETIKNLQNTKPNSKTTNSKIQKKKNLKKNF